MTAVAVFLGAGFGKPCNVPLTRELFDRSFPVDLASRAALVDRVLWRYARWREEHDSGAEQYLAAVENTAEWSEAVSFVSLRLVMAHGVVGREGNRLGLQQHQLTRAGRCPAHVAFWDAFWKRPIHEHEVAVLTTNYDIAAEQGLRLHPRPRVFRPGFIYGGLPSARLTGRGFPLHQSDDLTPSGSVPLFKLHGSISWELSRGAVVCHADCQPGISGKAAIVAPGQGKHRPTWAAPIWEGAAEALDAAPIWIVVGYSFPEYDSELLQLLTTASRGKTIHLFSPSAAALQTRVMALMSATRVHAHGPIPEAIADVRTILGAAAE